MVFHITTKTRPEGRQIKLECRTLAILNCTVAITDLLARIKYVCL